jgi:hypothetical protein
MADVPDQAATIEYMKELMRLEQEGERAPILIGPWSAFAVISLLQLSLRHPGISTSIKSAALDILGQLEPLFKGTPGQALIAASYDTTQDKPC